MTRSKLKIIDFIDFNENNGRTCNMVRVPTIYQVFDAEDAPWWNKMIDWLTSPQEGEKKWRERENNLLYIVQYGT